MRPRCGRAGGRLERGGMSKPVLSKPAAGSKRQATAAASLCCPRRRLARLLGGGCDGVRRRLPWACLGLSSCLLLRSISQERRQHTAHRGVANGDGQWRRRGHHSSSSSLRAAPSAPAPAAGAAPAPAATATSGAAGPGAPRRLGRHGGAAAPARDHGARIGRGTSVVVSAPPAVRPQNSLCPTPRGPLRRSVGGRLRPCLH